MNKLTTFLLVVTSVAIGFIVSACTNSVATNEVEGAPAKTASEWQKEKVGTLGTGFGTQADVYVMTDKDTNIDYIVIVTGSNDAKNSCITPRLTTRP